MNEIICKKIKKNDHFHLIIFLASFKFSLSRSLLSVMVLIPKALLDPLLVTSVLFNFFFYTKISSSELAGFLLLKILSSIFPTGIFLLYILFRFSILLSSYSLKLCILLLLLLPSYFGDEIGLESCLLFEICLSVSIKVVISKQIEVSSCLAWSSWTFSWLYRICLISWIRS